VLGAGLGVARRHAPRADELFRVECSAAAPSAGSAAGEAVLAAALAAEERLVALVAGVEGIVVGAVGGRLLIKA
jgi:glycine/serine hydroxymethyltransferase